VSIAFFYWRKFAKKRKQFFFVLKSLLGMIANLAAKKENPVQLLTKKLFVNFIF
jgi:hypothetical protein